MLLEVMKILEIFEVTYRINENEVWLNNIHANYDISNNRLKCKEFQRKRGELFREGETKGDKSRGVYTKF